VATTDAHRLAMPCATRSRSSFEVWSTRWRLVQVEDVDPIEVQSRTTASAMPPKSALGSRTLVPTATLAGLSLCRTLPSWGRA
jgi:hypothetical protein